MRFFGHPISINAVQRFRKQLNFLFINSLSHVNGTTVTPRLKVYSKPKKVLLSTNTWRVGNCLQEAFGIVRQHGNKKLKKFISSRTLSFVFICEEQEGSSKKKIGIFLSTFLKGQKESKFQNSPQSQSYIMFSLDICFK